MDRRISLSFTGRDIAIRRRMSKAYSYGCPLSHTDRKIQNPDCLKPRPLKPLVTRSTVLLVRTLRRR